MWTGGSWEWRSNLWLVEDSVDLRGIGELTFVTFGKGNPRRGLFGVRVKQGPFISCLSCKSTVSLAIRPLT